MTVRASVIEMCASVVWADRHTPRWQLEFDVMDLTAVRYHTDEEFEALMDADDATVYESTRR